MQSKKIKENPEFPNADYDIVVKFMCAYVLNLIIPWRQQKPQHARWQ